MTDYLGRSNPNWCRYLVLGECVNPKREKLINCKSNNCEFGRTPPTTAKKYGKISGEIVKQIFEEGCNDDEEVE